MAGAARDRAEGQGCLYALVHAPKESHEAILQDLVHPVVREVADSPDLDSLFFARYNKPDWQIRFRVLGRRRWVDGMVRPLVEERLEPLRERGLLEAFEFSEYQREYERYGGVEGMRLAEDLFFRDSLACLDLLQAERRGLLSKSRREYSLVMTERFLDQMGFEPQRRIDFYRFAYSWAIELGDWAAEELGILEERFQSLKGGLRDLLFGSQSLDPEAQWGGAEPARVARACLQASRPIVDELLQAHAAGRIHQELVHLAWSLTHMHCNRLGIDARAEAILRYFMHRLHEEGAVQARGFPRPEPEKAAGPPGGSGARPPVVGSATD